MFDHGAKLLKKKRHNDTERDIGHLFFVCATKYKLLNPYKLLQKGLEIRNASGDLQDTSS